MPVIYVAQPANAGEAVPTLTLPQDTDPLNAASAAGPLQHLADWAAKIQASLGAIYGQANSWAQAQNFNAGVNVGGTANFSGTVRIASQGSQSIPLLNTFTEVGTSSTRTMVDALGFGHIEFRVAKGSGGGTISSGVLCPAGDRFFTGARTDPGGAVTPVVFRIEGGTPGSFTNLDIVSEASGAVNGSTYAGNATYSIA